MATMNSGLGGVAGYGDNAFSVIGPTFGNLDDGSIFVDVTSVFGAGGINYFGSNYSGIYLNTNGLITFTGPNTAYTPVGIGGYNQPAIAPFWSDVDLNKGGEIYWDLDPTTGSVTITWLDVAPYSGTGTNSFQMVLTNTGGGDFSVEFIYEDIQWTDGYAGNATVGMTDGGVNDVILPGSGDPAALTNYDTTDFGNGDPDGTWEMDVSGGAFQPSDGTVSGTAGDDTIDDTYDGDPENDFVDNADGTGPNRNEDIISAGGGNDTVFAGLGNDTVFGGTGNDTLFGGLGNDTLNGDAGNDIINVAVGDVATGGDGDDSFLITDLGEPSGGTITITGGEGGETATGDTLDFQGLLGSGGVTYTGTGESGSALLADGTLINFSQIENVIVCFTAGTRISTPYGQRLVETLTTGDLVLTADNGPQPIRWIGKRRVPAIGKLAPIRIKAGTFANERDLSVSPQHRMLIDGWTSQLMFGHDEVFATAKHLVNGDTIFCDDVHEVTYIHIMFDQHEVIFAENTPSESFFPGATGLDAVSDEAREELFTIFPEIRSLPNSYGPTARLCLKRPEARLLQVA